MDLERKREIWREASRRYRAAHLDQVRKQERESRKRNYFKNKPMIKAHNKLRRAREKGAEKTEVIHLSVLADRDGWICHLCKELVQKDSWSMDHLIPLSLGGNHTYDNVALAHRLCNVRRGNKTIPLPLQEVQ